MKRSVSNESYGTPVTVRLPEGQFDQLSALADVDQVKVAQELRQAIRWYVDQRLSDSEAVSAQIEVARARNEAIFATMLDRSPRA